MKMCQNTNFLKLVFNLYTHEGHLIPVFRLTLEYIKTNSANQET